MKTSEPITIAIVEDNPDDFLLLKRALKKAGVEAEIRWLRDGEEAIDFFDRVGRASVQDGDPPNLVLLDSKLPKRDGMSVLRFIRHVPELRELPVLKLLSQPNAAEIDASLGAGANWCFPKSGLFRDVGEFVRELADTEKAEPQEAGASQRVDWLAP